MASPIDLSSIISLEEQIFVAAMNLQLAELAVPEENRNFIS